MKEGEEEDGRAEGVRVSLRQKGERPRVISRNSGCYVSSEIIERPSHRPLKLIIYTSWDHRQVLSAVSLPL